LSIFGMLFIDVYDSVFQFPPISSNFAQPQSTAWQQSTACSTLCEGDVSRCVR
jgi:hypothetical protein